MKKVLYFAALALMFAASSCEKSDIGGTATEKMAGQWYVLIDGVDEAGQPVADDYCDLFGCGTEGIMVSSCQGMLFKGCKIRDCSYHIMHLYGSENILFESCQFFRNREYELVNIYECQNVYFNNCMFANNTGNLFNIESPVTFRNCVILHDSMFLNFDNIYMENCISEEFFHTEQTLG